MLKSVADVFLEPGPRLAPPPLPRGVKPCALLPERADVVVIGAGVIGMSIAWEASRAGLSVAVIERGTAGGGATLSATGMLAASAEHEAGGGALLPFALESQRLWPAFAADLQRESGVDLDFRESGVVLAALSREELDRLRARYAFLVKSGVECAWVAGQALRALEPGLRPSASGAIHCPHDHQVDPRALVTALRAALAHRGVALVEHATDLAIDREGGVVAGVRLGEELCRTARVVLAAGAWIASSGLLPQGLSLPVRPVKGQSLALRARDGRQPLARIVWTEHVHLAPKRDGRLIVGATMEEAGFDAAVTAGGVYALLEGARRALPCVEEMEIEAIWTGFRPTSDDDAPIVGDVDGAGLLIAAGHHRNGVLLAPATAQALTARLGDAPMGANARALTLARFSQEI
jgi:glycine oxidase